MYRFEEPLPEEVIRHIETHCKVGTSDYSSALELTAREAPIDADPAKHIALMISAITSKVERLQLRCAEANKSKRSQLRTGW